jgi:hypothetical protein
MESKDNDETIAYHNKENKKPRGRKAPLVQLNSSISIRSNKKAMNTRDDDSNSQTRREAVNEESIRKNLLSRQKN